MDLCWSSRDYSSADLAVPVLMLTTEAPALWIGPSVDRKIQQIDSQLERVSFWKGGRIVAQVAVGRRGHVNAVADDHDKAVPYGDWIAYQPALLAAFSLAFLLVTAVRPWPGLKTCFTKRPPRSPRRPCDSLSLFRLQDGTHD